MTTAPWIQVETSWDDCSRPRHELEFTLLVPPHEVPQALRSEFDKQLNRFVIEIRYLDDEDFKRTPVDGVVCLRVGKKSRRLLGIELDTRKFHIASVQLEVQALEDEIKKAFEKLTREGQDNGERENYCRAMKAIETKRALLLNPSLLALAR